MLAEAEGKSLNALAQEALQRVVESGKCAFCVREVGG
jgi:hypothetical protein